jgi:hypothetical protein
MVILVATHGDLLAANVKDTKEVQQRANQMLAEIKRQFGDDFFFTDHAYVCNARHSSDVTELRQCLEEVKVALKEVKCVHLDIDTSLDLEPFAIATASHQWPVRRHLGCTTVVALSAGLAARGHVVRVRDLDQRQGQQAGGGGAHQPHDVTSPSGRGGKLD